MKKKIAVVDTYVGPKVVDTIKERVPDSSGWPIHVGAKVRINRQSAVTGGEITFIGKVKKVISEPHTNRILVIVQTKKGERSALPSDCFVRRS